MTTPELIPNGVPLSNVPGLTAAQVETLNDSWIGTAQEFIALHGTNDDLRNRLAQVLGIPRAALDDQGPGAGFGGPGVGARAG